MRTKLLAVCTSLFFSALPLAAQTSNAPQANGTSQDGGAATFRSRTELVLVPAVVVDSHGKHVTGLKQENFTLLDNGQPRKLSVFEEVSKDAANAKPLVFKGGYTNLRTDSTDRRQASILLIDTINTPYMLRQNGRDKMLQFLEKSARQGQPLAILLLTPHGIQQMSSFQSSPEDLAKALREVRLTGQATDPNPADAQLTAEVRMSGTGVDAALAMIAAQLQEAVDVERAASARDRARLTLAGLEQISLAYGGMPGRKSLIWATVGVPFEINDPHAFQNMDHSTMQLYEETTRALAKSNIAIYPIDLDGLIDEPGMQATTGSNRLYSGRSQSVTVDTTSALDAKNDQQAGMRALAESTGGQAFYNSNDIGALLKRALDDSQDYYMLGFTLESDHRSAGWHKLKVRTSDGKLHTLARTGFYVSPSVTQEPSFLTEARTALRDAVQAPVEISDLRVNVQLTGDTSDEKAGKTVWRQMFSVNLEPGEFVVNTAESNLIDLTVSVVALDSHHAVVAENTKQIRTKLQEATVAGLREGGLSVRDALEVPPESRELCFVVRDNQSGKVGSVVIPRARVVAKKK